MSEWLQPRNSSPHRTALRDHPTSRAVDPMARPKTAGRNGREHRGTVAGYGPRRRSRIAEITSGRAERQQGLVVTCKDWTE